MRQDERIGIVGGVGPHAGLDLTRKLFDHTRAEADQEHLPVMLYSFPDRIGERPAFLLGKTADNPGEAIGDIMAELARAGATVIGMPCNTAHSPRILDAALEKLNATGRPVRFVHMIDAVVRHVRQRCGEGARVGILSTLATLETRLYQDSLERAGLEALHPAPDGCAGYRRPSATASTASRPGIRSQSAPAPIFWMKPAALPETPTRSSSAAPRSRLRSPKRNSAASRSSMPPTSSHGSWSGPSPPKSSADRPNRRNPRRPYS